MHIFRFLEPSYKLHVNETVYKSTTNILRTFKGVVWLRILGGYKNNKIMRI